MLARRAFLATLLATRFAAGRAGAPPQNERRAAAQRELRRLMEGAVARGDIAGGALVVFHESGVVFREALGYRDLEAKTPFALDDLCYIASLGKPVVATFFMMLHDRGILSLDDPVHRWLPEFRDVKLRGSSEPVKPLNVWHLLCQRSGLPGNDDPSAIAPYLWAAPGEPPKPRKASAKRRFFGQPAELSEIVAEWARDGLVAQPGTFSWGSAGSIAAARVAEAATGKRFEVGLRELLFEPLKMPRATFHPTPAELQGLPRFYLRSSGGLQLERPGAPVIQPDGLVNPGGGLYTTAAEMANFMLLHNQRGTFAGHRLLSEKTLARMYRLPAELAAEAAPAVRYGRSGEEGPYGLGWNFAADGSWVRHLGASGVLGWVDLKVPCAGVLLSHTHWEGSTGLADELIAGVRKSFS